MAKSGVCIVITRDLLNKRKADYSAFKVSMNIKISEAIISYFLFYAIILSDHYLTF